MTPDFEEGLAALATARRFHRDGVRRHFTENLTDGELTKLAQALGKVREHIRPLRPGRVG